MKQNPLYCVSIQQKKKNCQNQTVTSLKPTFKLTVYQDQQDFLLLTIFLKDNQVQHPNPIPRADENPPRDVLPAPSAPATVWKSHHRNTLIHKIIIIKKNYRQSFSPTHTHTLLRIRMTLPNKREETRFVLPSRQHHQPWRGRRREQQWRSPLAKRKSRWQLVGPSGIRRKVSSYSSLWLAFSVRLPFILGQNVWG